MNDLILVMETPLSILYMFLSLWASLVGLVGQSVCEFWSSGFLMHVIALVEHSICEAWSWSSGFSIESTFFLKKKLYIII